MLRRRSLSNLRRRRRLSLESLESRRLLAGAEGENNLLVTTLVDELDFTNSAVSLREAIALANDQVDHDNIRFAPSLFSSSAAKLLLRLGELTVTTPLTIIGPGADRLTIDADNGIDQFPGSQDGFRLFNIDDGDDTQQIDVLFAGLTLSGGDVAASDQFGRGGAIRNAENLTLDAIVVADNFALDGGGISNPSPGNLNVVNSTISGNRAVNTDDGGGLGGGIFSTAGAVVNIANSTLSRNRAAIGGGAIHSTGQLSLTNSTLFQNFAASVGGGIIHNGAATLNSTIVSGNTNNLGDDNLAGGTFSGNFNLLGSGTLTAGANDIVSDSPLLGTLRANGGPTPLHILLPGSPALDAGSASASALSGFDQRGAPFNRLVGRSVDIGAYEHQVLSPDSFIVNTTDDELDYSNSAVSLREALNNADGSFGSETVSFDTALFSTPQTILLTLGELLIRKEITIAGPSGQSVTIDAQSQSRVFNILSSANQVALANLTITGGRTEDENQPGGGIGSESLSPLSLTNSQVIDNHTAGVDSQGGGIAVLGDLTLINSTVANNSTTGSGADGGGIASPTRGNITIINSTLSGNQVAGNGGAIYFDDGDVTITHSTITANTARTGGGIGVFADGQGESLVIRNSIVAGNAAVNNPDFTAPRTVAEPLVVRNSLIGDNAGTTLNVAATLNADGNLIGNREAPFDPLLGPLTNNGGPTQTHSLLVNSPAIDAGDSAAVARQGDIPALDQRGNLRVIGRIDIGALEMNPNPLDFGDGPERYPVTLAQNGARHTVSDLFLGSAVNGEADGQASANADAETDDDGVVKIASILSADVETTSSVSVRTSAAGKLDAWIDFNNDGIWLDTGEQIFNSVDVVAGINLLSFAVPVNLNAQVTAARFRLSTAGSLTATGAANDGEVEDYLVEILDDANFPAIVIDLPAGSTEAFIDGNDLTVKQGDVILFQAPLGSFGEINVHGSAFDDALQITIVEPFAFISLNLDGAAGADKLILIAADFSFDLANLNVTLSNLEAIDITGTGDNRLVLNVLAVKAASTTTDSLEVTYDFGDLIEFGAGWQADIPQFIDGQFTHIISELETSGTARLEIHNDRLFQNPLDRFDVDRNGRIEARDALRIINELRRRGGGGGALALPKNNGEISRFYFDVSGDNSISATDALRVVNQLVRLARRNASEGETAISLPLVDLDQYRSLQITNEVRHRLRIEFFVHPFGHERQAGISNRFNLATQQGASTSVRMHERQTIASLLGDRAIQSAAISGEHNIVEELRIDSAIGV